MNAKCSSCKFCGNRNLLKKYEDGKKAGKGYKQIRCRYKFINPVLQSDIIYDCTCWNARKHDSFCGFNAKFFKEV